MLYLKDIKKSFLEPDGTELPIELLQAIRARLEALNAYAEAVANHNRAQWRDPRRILRRKAPS